MKAPNKRWLLLPLAASMALAVAASAKLQAGDPVAAADASKKAVLAHAPTAVSRQATTLTLVETMPSIQEKRKSVDKAEAKELFSQKSWYVPPPPPPKPKPLPPPPPTAPPMPFVFMGSYQAPDKPLIIFLTKGDQLYNVSPGDVIDGIYRVEDIKSGLLEMTYLPLNIKQVLAVKDSS